MAFSQDSGGSDGLLRCFKQFIPLFLLVTVGLGAGFLTPLRDVLNVATIEAFAARLGWWGPASLLAIGAATPVVFLPRWPICVVASMLYGLFWGSVLGALAGVLGAGVHYACVRFLVKGDSPRLLQRFKLTSEHVAGKKALWTIFVLRAFPLTNSSATNLLAGTIKMPVAPFLLGSLLGMIPSTVMYAAGGKMLKQPEPKFYVLGIGLIVGISLVTFLAGKRLFRSDSGGGCAAP